MATDTFNSGSGTWQVPTGQQCTKIEGWGAGGGGGTGGGGPGEAGSGGGGGGYFSYTPGAPIAAGTNINYSVGSGGAGDTAKNGGNGIAGGASTVSTYSLTANGGGAGKGLNSGGASGGTATGGTVNTTGGTSSNPGGGTGTTGGTGANGGAGGAGGGSSSPAGQNGTAPGGGGGGGGRNTAAGDGAAGRITFTYSAASGNTYNETGSGGSVGGSSALPSKSTIITITNSGVLGGSSALPSKTFNEVLSGGAVSGSSAIDLKGSLNSNLSAFWKLEESSGTRYDSTYHANDLSQTNTPGSATGIVGNGATFVSASNQVLSIADNATINLASTNWSISLWVKFSALTNNAANDYLGIISKGSGGATYAFTIQYRISVSQLQIQFYNGGTTYTLWASTFGAFSTGVWYNIIATYTDSSKATTISVNGTQNSGTSSVAVVDSSYGLSLGRGYYSNTYNSSCTIDAVGLWKRVLTTNEKAKLYRLGHGNEYPFENNFTETLEGGTVGGDVTLPSKVTTFEIEGSILGNSESIPSKETIIEVDGGTEGSGNALSSTEITEIITGGSLAGDAANYSSIWNEISDGGSLGGGIVPPEMAYVPLGGSLSGGEAAHYLSYAGNGGAILGGMAFKGSTEYPTGGSRSSGIADVNFIGNILINGGSKSNGSSIKQSSYTPVLAGRSTGGGLSRVTHIIKSITITASGVLIKGFINGVGIGEVASGGTRLGGTAISFVVDSVNGGSKTSGKALVSKLTNSARPTGNSLAGGITKPSLKTTISILGGIEANGIALIGWTLPVALVDDTVGYGTSIIISGEADYYKSLLSFIGKGGIIIQGTASFEVTVSDYSYESEATSIELRGTVIATLYYNNDRNCLIPCKIVDKIARNVRTRCVQPIIVAGEEKRVLNGTVKSVPSLAVLPAIVACRQKLF